jgi:hypothetical protein
MKKITIDCYSHDGRLIVTRVVYCEVDAQDVRNMWHYAYPNGYVRLR